MVVFVADGAPCAEKAATAAKRGAKATAARLQARDLYNKGLARHAQGFLYRKFKAFRNLRKEAFRATPALYRGIFNAVNKLIPNSEFVEAPFEADVEVVRMAGANPRHSLILAVDSDIAFARGSARVLY